MAEWIIIGGLIGLVVFIGTVVAVSSASGSRKRKAHDAETGLTMSLTMESAPPVEYPIICAECGGHGIVTFKPRPRSKGLLCRPCYDERMERKESNEKASPPVPPPTRPAAAADGEGDPAAR